MSKSGNIAHFLEFELDARTGELRVAGSEPVRLADQPLQILLALLERPGELVSRGELRERLWPSDTVVEFEHSISAAMNRLRRLIGDSPESPRLIETIARRGYRLKVAVDWGDVAAPKSPPKPAAAEKLGASALYSRAPQHAWEHVLYLAGAVGVAIAAITVMSFQSRGTFSAASTTVWKQRQLTVNSSENPVSGAAISPDGKYLAYTDLRGIKLKLIATGESRDLESPDAYRGAAPNWQIDSWLPDSTHFFAIADLPMQPSALWVISVAGGVQRKLATGVAPWGVSPDGSWLAVTANDDREVWIMQSNGENRRRVVLESEDSRFRAVQWSPDGHYLAYIRNSRRSNQQESRIEVVPVEGSSAHILLSGNATHEVSTLEESFQDMVWLSDGRLIFTGGEPDIHGLTCNLWQARIDLRNISASVPNRITNWSGFCVYNLSQTADGKKLIYARSSDLSSVYVAQLDSSKLRIASPSRLTLTDDLSSPSGWSPDSSEVYVRSNREGTWGLYRQAVAGKPAAPIITGLDGLSYSAPVTPDGNWILLIELLSGSNREKEKLVRIPIVGGPAEELSRGQNFSVACPRVPSASCVIGELSPDKRQLIFSSLDASRGRGLELARFADEHAAELNWDLSPDGLRVVIYSDLSSHFSIMALADPSRPSLHSVSNIHLRAMTWAANGSGFFCANSTQLGAQLVYLDPQEQIRVLWEVPGNNVFLASRVSPDGRHLAIQTSAVSSNMWMIENF